MNAYKHVWLQGRTKIRIIDINNRQGLPSTTLSEITLPQSIGAEIDPSPLGHLSTTCYMPPLLMLIYSGWWYTYPSEKYEFVSWDYDIPNIWKVITIPWFQSPPSSSGGYTFIPSWLYSPVQVDQVQVIAS